MRDVQELYDDIIDNIIKQTALEQVESISGGGMRLYHAGQVLVYKSVAEALIRHHGCKAKFFETKENSNE